MDFTKLKDPAIKQGTDEFVSGQAGNLSESVANSAKYGWNSSLKTFNQAKYYSDKFWDSVGVDFSEELNEREKELQIYTEIARELRDKNANYLAGSGSNGLIRNLGVGVVNGFASMALNAPEVALNVASGFGVGNLGSKLALTGAKKLAFSIAGEVVENVAYDAFDKISTLEEEYNGDYFLESVKNNAVMGTGLGLFKAGVSRAFNEATKVNKKVVPNSEKRKAPNNPEIVSPEEILTDVKNTIDNKNKATGFLNEADELEASKTYLGKSAEEVEVLQAKGVENLTEAELQIVKNYEDGNFDIEAEKVMEVVKKEADPEIKVEKMKEENKTLIEPIKNEIDSEKATTLEVINKSIEEENHFIDLENEKIRKNYESELEKAELYNIMEDMKPEGEPRNYKEVEPPQYKERKKLVTAEELDTPKTFDEAKAIEEFEAKKIAIEEENKIMSDNYEKQKAEIEEYNRQKEVDENRIIEIEKITDDYKHLTKDVEVETSKVDGEDAKSKKEVVKPTDEEIAEAEKQTKKIIKNIKSNKGMNSKEKRKRIDYAQNRFESYKKGSKNASYLKEKIFNESDVMEGKTVATPYSGNKIQELLMIRSMKNVKNYLDEKGLLPNRLTFRKILKTNIIDHYENVQKRTANFIANSLNSVVDGRNMDFVETIKNIEELGFKLKDLINDIDGTKVKELPPHLQSAVMTLKESIGSLEKVFKSFDADFDIELAVANAHFSRNNFFKVLGKDLGLKFDSKGNLDLRKLTPEQIRKMAEKYAFANRELFNGENGGQKMANAFTTFNNLLLELKAGGLRGTGGADTLRTTAFHNFSILAKAFDEELISKQNFIKTLEAFDYKEGRFGFANLIKGLSEAKALKDTLGDELGNFVDSGSHASKRFGEIFGIENSGAYIKEIQGVQRFIRKKMGLHSEVSSPILSAMDSVLSGIYFGIKPLMATFQVAEVGVSALHRAIAWENGLLSAPMNLVRDMAGLTKDIKMREASDFYKVIADGTQELIDDVFKEIDNINLKDVGTNMSLIKRTLGKIDDVADTLSLMRPFEKFTDKIAGMYAVNKTKSFLADGYDVITKNPIVKQALDVAGFTKEEFVFLSKNLIDSDAVDSGSIYKIIKDMDTGDLKKAYNISDKEMTFLLTEKFNRLQEIILETGKSTKANQLDYLDGSTVGSAMINKSVMFLRKSGIQSVRRAWDMFVASAQHHNAGSPVNSIGVKNMAKLAMMTPLFFYLNGVSKSFKDFATTNKDVVEIIDENFSLLTDEYGDVEDVEKIMFELAKSPVESLYLNLVINSGMIGNMVDRVSRSIAKGDAVGVAKAIEPRASKTIRKRILD